MTGQSQQTTAAASHAKIDSSRNIYEAYFETTAYFKKEYGEKSIVFMQVGAFFEVYGLQQSTSDVDDDGNLSAPQWHGSELQAFSRICGMQIALRTLATTKSTGTGKPTYVIYNGLPVAFAGFKDNDGCLLDKRVSEMVAANYVVAVYEQDEAAPKPGRTLSGVYSPGTFFCTSDNAAAAAAMGNGVGGAAMSNKTCCVWMEYLCPRIRRRHGSGSGAGNGQLHVGATAVDICTGHVFCTEFCVPYVKNPTLFNDLVHFLSVHTPSETLVILGAGNGTASSPFPVPSPEERQQWLQWAQISSKRVHCVDLLVDTNPESSSAFGRRARNCEKQTYQAQLLRTFYAIHDPAVFMARFGETVYATQSLCYLLDYLYQHNPHLVQRLAEPVFENTGDRLVLANHSLRQLHMIAGGSGVGSGGSGDDSNDTTAKYACVANLLNNCVTAMGRRQFAYQLLNPTTNVEWLQKEYDITEHLVAANAPDATTSSVRGLFLSSLYAVRDISNLLRQLTLRKMSPRDVAALHQSCRMARNMWMRIATATPTNTAMSKLAAYLPHFDALSSHFDSVFAFLETSFDLDVCRGAGVPDPGSGSCFIRAGVDAELDATQTQLATAQQNLETYRQTLDGILVAFDAAKATTKKKGIVVMDDEDDEGCSTGGAGGGGARRFVKINETEKNFYSIQATKARCELLRALISKGAGADAAMPLTDLSFRKQSASGMSIESPQIVEACDALRCAKLQMVDQVGVVFSRLLQQLQETHMASIECISQFITQLDIVLTKAHLAVKYNYCKPTLAMSDDMLTLANSNSNAPTTPAKSFLQIRALRHALIERIQHSELYVANDVELGRGAPDGILLYGTNAVGKTSFIRAVGVATIMAQAGLFVPAASFHYRPYRSIITRILGNDDLHRGLSSFVVEMVELNTILTLGDENSLVLGDELCAGTETPSAVSLFVAGLQWQQKRGVSFLFATHLHEIVDFDELHALQPSIVCRHMEVVYHPDKDCLVYNRTIQEGPGSDMYGLETCKALGMPPAFLDAAFAIRNKYYPRTASLLESQLSRYNRRHVRARVCERCGTALATEVHHLQFQEGADADGIIRGDGGEEGNNANAPAPFHKHHAANLVSLCEQCHQHIHDEGVQLRKTKTTAGTLLLPVAARVKK